jgi:integrase
MKTKEQYLNFLEVQGYSKNTITQRNYYANKVIGKELNEENIQALIVKYNHQPFRSFIKEWLRFQGITEEHIKRWVLPIKGRKHQRELKTPTYEEVMEFIGLLPERTQLACRIMFECGLRVSEVLNLERTDIDTEKGLLRGVGKGNKAFELPISPELCSEIKKLLRNDLRRFIFKYPDFRGHRQKLYKDIMMTEINMKGLDRYGSIYDRGAMKRIRKELTWHPHMFRHAAATYLKSRGMDLRDIQVFLRHKNLQTVQIYAAVHPEDLKDKLLNAFGGGGDGNT